MKKWLGLFLLSVFVATPASAAPITINFDDPVSTDITSAYAGLTFNAPLAGTGPVRTYASTAADTPGNLLGLSGSPNFFAFNQSDGAIDIVFDDAVSFVSIQSRFVIATDAFLGIGGLPFMAVYNSSTISAANRIGLVEWNNPGDTCLAGNFCFSEYDTLDFTSNAADIKAIRLTGSLSAAGGPSRRAMFDTLTYDVAATPAPEPASLTLLLTGGVLAGVRRVRRRSRT
jgi:hypothetical protein